MPDVMAKLYSLICRSKPSAPTHGRNLSLLRRSDDDSTYRISNYSKLFLLVIFCLSLSSCERQRWRLEQRQTRINHYNEMRQQGYRYRDSIFRAEQDSIYRAQHGEAPKSSPQQPQQQNQSNPSTNTGKKP